MGKKQLKLSISTPCSEDWNNMTADKNGKFCAACQKTVIDFSVMTDAQIIRYFTDFQGETCGRLTEKQLNSVISEPLTAKPNNRWAWALSALLLPTVAASQTVKTTEQSEIETPSVASIPRNDIEAKSVEKALPIEGKIMELGSDLPLTSTWIYLFVNGKIIESTEVNSEDLFKIYLPQVYENQHFTLIISSKGMEKRRLDFNNYTTVLNSQLFISMDRIKAADSIKLRGTVVDASNEPLPFATIALKEGSIIKTGAQSDFDGIFRLEFSSQNADNQAFEIEVSMVGMKTEVLKISLAEANKGIKIMLIEEPMTSVFTDCKLVSIQGGVKFTQSQIESLPTRDTISSFYAVAGGISSQVVAPRNFFQRVTYRIKNLFRKKHRD